MQKSLYIMLYSICCAWIMPLYAQQDEIATEVNLNPVIVTGTGTYQRLKTTITPVKVISAKEISQSGATETQKLLELKVPSLSFSPNAMGSYLSMNGLPNKYVLVLINGRRLNGDMSQNIDLNRINPQDIHRIEILSGAASALYGSDAIGGVINIITKKANEPISLSSHTQYNSYGAYTQSANVDVKQRKWASHTSAQYAKDKGWQQSNLEYTDPDSLTTEPTLIQTCKAYNSKIINQKFTFTPNHKWEMYLDGQHYNYNTNRPTYSEKIAGGSKYNLSKEAFNIGMGARYKLKQGAYISVDAFADKHMQDKDFLIKDKSHNIGDKERYKEQAIFDIRAKGIFHFSTHSQSVFGLEHRRVNLKRPIAFLDKSIYNLSAFAQHQQQLMPNLKAIVGLSFDYYQNSKWHLSPKVAIMYNLGDINWRLNYANGFRAADIKEMYYFYASSRSITLGNEELKPEESHYFSFNTEYSTERFSLSITPYINFISQMINIKTERMKDLDSTYVANLKAKAAEVFNLSSTQLTKIKSLRSYQNIDKARIQGIEANAQAHLSKSIHAYTNYAYALAQGWTENNERQALERSICHSLTYGAQYNYKYKKYKLNIDANLRTQSERLYPNDDYGNAPGYTVMNLMSHHSFGIENDLELSLSFGINNLFNEIDDRPYRVNYGLFSPGRSFVFGLKLQWH